jgi:peptidoglycan hydrolase-like protein with peptidoglycan-binding domain
MLQQWLNAHGFVIAATGPGSPGNETTTFGILTDKALIKFQRSQGLPATGYLGPLTRAALAAFK